MALQLHFTHRDLLRSRFAISPLWETVAAVRSLHDARQWPYHVAWRRAAGHSLPLGELLPVIALQPRHGWSPDFLSTTPAGPEATIEEELATLAALRPGAMRADLERTLADQHDPALHREVAAMLADPAAGRDRLAGVLRLAWERLIAPHWPRVRALLAADVAHHSRLLAEGGLQQLLPELHAGLSWREDTLVLRSRFARRYDLAGDGLVLLPSAFSSGQPVVRISAADLPMLAYPARGVGALWERPAGPPDALAALLGRTRAALLAGLGEAAGTSVLAQRYGLSPSTVSAHLTVLRDAGLVTAWRHRHEVRYERSPLGSALVAGSG